MENKTPCEFYEANGYHCVIMDDCICCRQPAPLELKKGQDIEFRNFGALDGVWKITDIKGGRLKLQPKKESE